MGGGAGGHGPVTPSLAGGLPAPLGLGAGAGGFLQPQHPQNPWILSSPEVGDARSAPASAAPAGAVSYQLKKGKIGTDLDELCQDVSPAGDALGTRRSRGPPASLRCPGHSHPLPPCAWDPTATSIGVPGGPQRCCSGEGCRCCIPHPRCVSAVLAQPNLPGISLPSCPFSSSQPSLAACCSPPSFNIPGTSRRSFPLSTQPRIIITFILCLN